MKQKKRKKYIYTHICTCINQMLVILDNLNKKK